MTHIWSVQGYTNVPYPRDEQKSRSLAYVHEWRTKKECEAIERQSVLVAIAEITTALCLHIATTNRQGRRPNLVTFCALAWCIVATTSNA